MDVVHEYLNELASASKSSAPNQITQLTKLLNLNPHINSWIVRLNQANIVNNGDISTAVSKVVDDYNLYDNEWLAFNEVVVSFVRLCNQMNVWSSLESFDLYTTFLLDLSVAFNNNSRGHLLSFLVKDVINVILPLLIKLDYQLYYKEFCTRPRLTYLASILLKLFNNIRSQINDTPKKTIILFVSNKLCLVYFKLSNPLLCRNIFSNMNNANLKFTGFSRLEQVQYRFYLAKFYLIKDQLVDGYRHLEWCLENCSGRSNSIRILKYLLPVGMVIGKVAKYEVILGLLNNQKVPFLPIYYELDLSLRQGNYQRFNDVIVTHSQYLKDENLLLMLINKSKLIILRNLVHKTWQITGRPSNLDYDAVKIALQTSLGPNIERLKPTFPIFQDIINIDDHVIENVFITLIDQNLLKGKIFPRLRKVALSKSNAFAKIDEINFMRFGNSKLDNWMNV